MKRSSASGPPLQRGGLAANLRSPDPFGDGVHYRLIVFALA